MDTGSGAIIPGHNPEVGFLNCGDAGLTVNISTHTGFDPRPDVEALRAALDELARRAPLLVARLELLPHRTLGPHHRWRVPDAPQPIPLEVRQAEPHDAATARFCAAGGNRAIDPTREPPLIVTLLRHPSGRCDLVTTLHHALYDGASCGFVFYAIKRLYAAAMGGTPLHEVQLPRITNPSAFGLARRQLGGSWQVTRALASGLLLLARESRFRHVPVPGRETSPGARSLHHTLYLDVRSSELRGVKRLLERVDGTLNELMQAAVSRAFFPWGRAQGFLSDTLPLATTFDVRRPEPDRYALGNFETAACVELRDGDIGDRERFLRRLIDRSRSQKQSSLPLGHYLALTLLTSAPSGKMPKIVATVANRGLLLFSYVGSDFAQRYLGHFGDGGGEQGSRLRELVLEHRGDGSGYVSSAPPMGLVLTIKRLRRRLALNFSVHDRLADQAALERFAASVQEEVATYASIGG